MEIKVVDSLNFEVTTFEPVGSFDREADRQIKGCFDFNDI